MTHHQDKLGQMYPQKLMYWVYLALKAVQAVSLVIKKARKVEISLHRRVKQIKAQEAHT